MHRHSLGQLNAHFAHRFGRNALRFQGLQIGLCVVMLSVDTQCHGRGRLGGLQNVLPLLRVVVLQALDPPSGMVPLRCDVRFGLSQQGFAFS